MGFSCTVPLCFWFSGASQWVVTKLDIGHRVCIFLLPRLNLVTWWGSVTDFCIFSFSARCDPFLCAWLVHDQQMNCSREVSIPSFSEDSHAKQLCPWIWFEVLVLNCAAPLNGYVFLAGVYLRFPFCFSYPHSSSYFDRSILWLCEGIPLHFNFSSIIVRVTITISYIPPICLANSSSALFVRLLLIIRAC